MRKYKNYWLTTIAICALLIGGCSHNMDHYRHIGQPDPMSEEL